MTDRAGAPAARPGAESHDKSEAHLFVFTADKAGMGGLDNGLKLCADGGDCSVYNIIRQLSA